MVVGQRPVVLVAEQVRDVQQRVGLRGDRLGHLGMGVAQRRDGDARQEVEVAAALAVDEPRALPFDELHRGGP